MSERIALMTAELFRFKTMFESVRARISYFEVPEFVCRNANRQYASAHGFTTATILGRTAHEIIGERFQQVLEAGHDTVFVQKKPLTMDTHEVDQAGNEVVMEMRVTPQLDPDGAVVGLFVLSVDVTSTRRLSADLQNNERRLARFLAASEEGVVFLRGTQIADANPAFLDLMGQSLAEVQGRELSDFLAPGEFAKLQAGAAAATGAAAVRGESVLIGRAG